ncbi:restriction endonuclease [Lonepinella koalarum]|uniref:restriction endonuclease n=1 Tax=Lonepinella koalarum TaxID=53417 RepID=UPI003F6DBB94
MKDFSHLSRRKQQDILMPIIIKLLQNLGGKASREELRNEIKTSQNGIPEDFIDEVKLSKNGREYRPFNFVFNFSISNLEFSGFLFRPERGQFQLTEKGRACNSSVLCVKEDIYALSEPIWKERSEKRSRVKNILADHFEEELDDDLVENDDIEVNEDWKNELKKRLFSMPSQKFEIFCRALVKAMGVDIDDTKGQSLTRDGGIDGYGYIVSDDFRTSRVAIQAKRWNENQKVRLADVDQFVGAMMFNRAEFGIFITTTDFTRDAIERSRTSEKAITLINGDKIIELVEKYQLYIKKITVLDSFYTEEN